MMAGAGESAKVEGVANEWQEGVADLCGEKPDIQ